MAIAFRADAHDDHDAATGTTYTVTKPTGLTSGDGMLLWVEAIGTGLSVTTAPSGWTLVGSETGNSNILSVLYKKVAGGSEPSSYAIVLSNSVKGHASILAYSGTDGTDPIDAVAHGTAGLNVTTAPPAVTAGVSSNWLVYNVFGRHTFAGAAQSFTTSDGSDVERHDHGSNSGSGFDVSHAVYDSNRTQSSGSLSRTVTASATENAIAWWALSLKPAGGALAARIYQAAVNAPQAAPSLRARIYAAAMLSMAPSGGKTGRIYQAYLQATLPAGHPGQSGIYICVGGVLHSVAIYSCVNGQIV